MSHPLRGLGRSALAGLAEALASGRIAAPMLGGMVTAPLLSLFVVPALYALMRRGRVQPAPDADA